MALIECDECGATVSDRAVACPKCGNPLGAHPAAAVKKGRAAVPRKKGATPSALILLLALFAIIFIIHQYSATSDSSAKQDLSAADTSSTLTGAASAPTPVASSGGQSATPAPPDAIPVPTMASSSDNDYAAKVAACVRPGVIYSVPARTGTNPTVRYKASLELPSGEHTLTAAGRRPRSFLRRAASDAAAVRRSGCSDASAGA
jgi:colicin import membrane protein